MQVDAKQKFLPRKPLPGCSWTGRLRWWRQAVIELAYPKRVMEEIYSKRLFVLVFFFRDAIPSLLLALAERLHGTHVRIGQILSQRLPIEGHINSCCLFYCFLLLF